MNHDTFESVTKGAVRKFKRTDGHDSEGEEAMEKKAYTPPKLNKWGTVADLTKTGNTMPGTDGKGGSAASTGG